MKNASSSFLSIICLPFYLQMCNWINVGHYQGLNGTCCHLHEDANFMSSGMLCYPEPCPVCEAPSFAICRIAIDMSIQNAGGGGFFMAYKDFWGKVC